MGITLAMGFITPIYTFILNRLCDYIIEKLKEIKKAPRTLKLLETTILAARTEFQKLDTSLLEGRVQSVLQDRWDTLTILCYEAEDLMEDIALKITVMRKRLVKPTRIHNNQAHTQEKQESE